ncbi:hypothetical protein RN346_01115 [Halomonas sp. PAMB 3232]|uniref:hypothetical protein n=1 Tax=Halomonas sp. PAMB 3232 TaxID=3075221 RepID=UPI002896C1EA|nr:hypothetical protein [Halomonas sp. PAMB 3232]WNL39185.1 hypothetical protein RN346_01115 [Halomonas sp. PAMB 3232]
MRLSVSLASLALIVSGVSAGQALAQTVGERLTGNEIRELIWGHQVQGAMAGDQAYSEIYLPNGEIVGDGYSGQASIEGDTMCFDYGGDDVSCYGVRLDDDGRIEWIEEDSVVGYGDISDAP